MVIAPSALCLNGFDLTLLSVFMTSNVSEGAQRLTSHLEDALRDLADVRQQENDLLKRQVELCHREFDDQVAQLERSYHLKVLNTPTYIHVVFHRMELHDETLNGGNGFATLSKLELKCQPVHCNVMHHVAWTDVLCTQSTTLSQTVLLQTSQQLLCIVTAMACQQHSTFSLPSSVYWQPQQNLASPCMLNLQRLLCRSSSASSRCRRALQIREPTVRW